MARAENDLLDASWEAQREIERADELIDEIERNAAELTDEDIEQFKNFTYSADAPAEWHAVRIHIEKGEFTWREVLEGAVDSHPDVAAALAATTAARKILTMPARQHDDNTGRKEVSKEEAPTDDEYFDAQNLFDD